MAEIIKELTCKQIASFPRYVEKWIKLGLTTQQKNHEDAIIDFGNLQKQVLQKSSPAPTILLNSPNECWIAVLVASFLKHFDLKPAKKEVEINNPIWAKVGAKMRKQIESQNVDEWKKIFENNNFNLLLNEVEEQVKTDKSLQKIIYPYFDCQYWAGFFAFYDVMENELGIEFEVIDKLNVLRACQPYGMVWPLDNLCAVCQPPTVIEKNDSGLHCTTGPALSYNGDNEIYALNGVVLDKRWVMTPAEEIKADEILKEQNVEIRRELLRKVGIEKIFEQLPHKVIETKGTYTLYSIDLSPTVRGAKYLKMVNPSIGVFHLEGVDPGVKSVDEALRWRNKGWFTNAEILT
jgi:hypothetical protein